MTVCSVVSKRYDGYQVLRLRPQNGHQVNKLKRLSNDTELDFWIRPGRPGHHVDLSVPPNKMALISQLISDSAINSTVLINDLQREIDGQSAELKRQYHTLSDPLDCFHAYQPLSAIYVFLEQLVRKYPSRASLLTIGSSVEGVDLKVLKITSGHPGRTRSAAKPSIWVDAGIHAREWVAPPAAMFIALSLVSGYDQDSEDRMWRKNRARTRGTQCRGTDLNRNFDFHWAENGVSHNPCDETYPGPRAFSEPESQAVSDFLLKQKANLKLYLTFHSYGQYWFVPWGYTKARAPGYQNLVSKARVAAGALAKNSGTKYEIGTPANLLYTAAGGSDDWAYGVVKVPYVYCLELRPSGSSRYTFVLPASQIRPTCQETWLGAKSLMFQLTDEFGKRRG
ncbi:Carboxypeptidase A4 [Halotydeus destructor]|nr:Carboxypeptidase A4 [Halotydeus destructor]